MFRLALAMNVFFVTFLLFGQVWSDENDLRRIDSIKQEQPCISAGGICTIAADCPNGSLSEQRGLCPNQRSDGIECCHGISVRETRCTKHGGACMPSDNFCNPRLRVGSVTDCPENTICCVLV